MHKARLPNLNRIDKYFDLSAKKRRKIIFRISCLTAIPFIIVLYVLFHVHLMATNSAPLLFSGILMSYVLTIMIVIWLWEDVIPNAIIQKKGEPFWLKAVDVIVTRALEDNRNTFHVRYQCILDDRKRERVGIRAFNYNPVKTMGNYYIRGFKYRNHYVLIENIGYIGVEPDFTYKFRL